MRRSVLQQTLKCGSVIAGSAATTVEITRLNSKSVWTTLLRFGYAFCITVLAPDPKGHVLQNQFSSWTHQNYDNVDESKYHNVRGVSNFSYDDFDIKDKQKIIFLELVVVYVPVCLVSF